MLKQKKYKNVIFDLGGVLVNWKPKQILKKIFKDKKIMPFEKWEEIIDLDIFPNIEKGILSQKKALELVPSKYNKEEVCKFLENIPDHLFPLAEGINIFNLVKKQGYKTYVLSNFSKEFFEKSSIIHQYDNFLKQFDGIILSYKVKKRKPEPEIYKILIESYSIKPNESIFLDDREDNIEEAKRAGIDGIVYKDHEFAFEELKKLNIII